MSFLVNLCANPIFAPNQQNLGVLGHNLWTTDPKWMFFWLKSHCFKVLNPWKKEYNPKFSLVWKLVALVCPKYSQIGTRVHGMVSGHNLRTTDPNFMFPSIFHNVLRCLIHLNHQNKGLPLNSCSFLGKSLNFWYHWEKCQTFGPGTGPNLWDQTSHEKHATTLHFLFLWV